MTNTNDIDMMLTLHPHGWSTCRIFTREKCEEFLISHVFGDAYYDLIHGVLQLMNKKKEATCVWYSEPGGVRLQMRRIMERQDKIRIKMEGFSESYGDQIHSYEEIMTFDVKEKQWVALVYLQLKKLAVLLQEKAFATHRRGVFPFREFTAFEDKVKIYLNL